MLKLQQCQIAGQIPIYLIAFLKPKIGISIILIAVTYLGNEGVTTIKEIYFWYHEGAKISSI